MPLYVVKISYQTLQELDREEEKQGAYTKRVLANNATADNCATGLSFISTVVSCGLVASLKTGFWCLAAAGWGLLSADATISKLRLQCAPEASRISREALICEDALDSSAVIGAFPDALISSIRQEGRSIAASMDRLHAVSMEGLLRRKPRGTIPCLDRINTFWMPSELQDQVRMCEGAIIEKKKQFHFNPHCDSSTRSKVVYLKCNVPVERIFLEGAIVYPNGRFKLYEHISDAIDAPEQGGSTYIESQTMEYKC